MILLWIGTVEIVDVANGQNSTFSNKTLFIAVELYDDNMLNFSVSLLYGKASTRYHDKSTSSVQCKAVQFLQRSEI